MTSRDVISGLNEHLLHVLKSERGRSQECERMRTELDRYQQKFAVLVHQQVKNLKKKFATDAKKRGLFHAYMYNYTEYVCRQKYGATLNQWSIIILLKIIMV